MNGCVGPCPAMNVRVFAPGFGPDQLCRNCSQLDRWVQELAAQGTGTGPGRMKSRRTSVAQQSVIASRRDTGQFSKSR